MFYRGHGIDGLAGTLGSTLNCAGGSLGGFTLGLASNDSRLVRATEVFPRVRNIHYVAIADNYNNTASSYRAVYSMLTTCTSRPGMVNVAMFDLKYRGTRRGVFGSTLTEHGPRFSGPTLCFLRRR